MWECIYVNLQTTDPDVQQFHANRPRKDCTKTTEKKIIDAVRADELFGMVECSLHAPCASAFERLFFWNVTHFLKCWYWSWRCFGCHERICIGTRFVEKSKTKLDWELSSENLLLASPLSQWYLEKGLVVTKVLQVIEYTPSRCFEHFSHEISDAWRCGDENPDKEPFG